MRMSFLAVAATLLSGCTYDTPAPKTPDTSGQSYAEALGAMCDVDKLAAIAPDEDPLSLGRKRTEWIQQNVVNADGIYLRTWLSVRGPGDQASALRDEAKKEAGLATCALADDLEKNGLGGLSP